MQLAVRKLRNAFMRIAMHERKLDALYVVYPGVAWG